MVLFNQIKVIATKYPLVRGIISYSLMMPASTFVQQTMEGKRWGNYDWWSCLNFGLYGAFFAAPTLHAWLKLLHLMYPHKTFKNAMIKAAIGSISFTPFAVTSFYILMTLLEGKTVREGREEVAKKFLPTYKIAMLCWPFVYVINFTLIPENNRVPFISLCGFLWATFLAYMKNIDSHKAEL